jgi:hypothetical protein
MQVGEAILLCWRAKKNVWFCMTDKEIYSDAAKVQSRFGILNTEIWVKKG